MRFSNMQPRCYVTPLLGAYIADAHWGRFKTICWAIFLALIGHIMLIVSAVPGVVEKKSAIAPFVIALIVMGLGLSSFYSFLSQAKENRNGNVQGKYLSPGRGTIQAYQVIRRYH
jgi:dipeptide/tripeptide permease